MPSRKEMLEILCTTIEISMEGISEDTVLEELGDAWDSVNRLSVISVIDTYADHDVPFNTVLKSKTMGDLIDLVCLSSETANLSN